MINIDNILINLGIMPNKTGFNYIKQYLLADNEISIMESFKEIAKNNNTTTSTVYGAVRRTLNAAEASDKLKNIDLYFNVKIYDKNHPMTNSEFLSLLKLLIRNNKI